MSPKLLEQPDIVRQLTRLLNDKRTVVEHLMGRETVSERAWFQLRALEVIANSGQTPLLGVGLLLAKELRVDYSNLELTLTLKPKRAGL